MDNEFSSGATCKIAAASGFFVVRRDEARRPRARVGHGVCATRPHPTDGDAYDIRKLEPREVTDPRSGEVVTIWGGYATARDRDLAAKDAMLQAEFKKSGARPAELFAPEARDIPLYITLRNRPGKGFTDIGSLN